MFSLSFNSTGILMLIWYACIRWTWFADRVKYSWAYAPINMTTAFLSIVFIIPTLFSSSFIKSNAILAETFYWLAIFLMVRNIYYSIEDIADLIKAIVEPTPPLDVKTQIFFIIVDLIMVLYPYLYIIKR